MRIRGRFSEVRVCSTVTAVITLNLKIEALSFSEHFVAAYTSARCPDTETHIWHRLLNLRLYIFLTVCTNLALCQLPLPGKILPACVWAFISTSRHNILLARDVNAHIIVFWVYRPGRTEFFPMFQRNVLPPYSWCIIIDLNEIQSPCRWRQCVLPNRRERLIIFRGVTGLTQKVMIHVIIIIIIIIISEHYRGYCATMCISGRNATDRVMLTICCHTCLYEARYSV
jgi:hypothetical protein